MIVLPEKEISSSSLGIRLRTLNQLEEMRNLVELQRQIWGYGEENADLPYPARNLFAIAQSGGQVAGAFLQQRIVGFSMAWIGLTREDRLPYLHSQLVGVLEAFRHREIGLHLKQYQREFALESGLGRVSWTFDPLRPANANLNIRKLGAVVERYLPDYYGQVRSRLDVGLTSHRVWADWYVSSPRVRHRLAHPLRALSQIPPLPRIGLSWQDPSKQDFTEWEKLAPRFLIELPRQPSPSQAQQWQRDSGRILEKSLGNGYRIGDFLVVEGMPRRNFYLLERTDLADLLQDRDQPDLEQKPPPG